MLKTLAQELINGQSDVTNEWVSMRELFEEYKNLVHREGLDESSLLTLFKKYNRLIDEQLQLLNRATEILEPIDQELSSMDTTTFSTIIDRLTCNKEEALACERDILACLSGENIILKKLQE